jgi:hypothetical protein
MSANKILIKHYLDNLLSALEAEHPMTPCLRTNGSMRAAFDTVEEAQQMIDTNPNYSTDVITLCGHCGKFHCSQISWLEDRPWETRVDVAGVN